MLFLLLLPAPALGDRHGGPVPLDPADREGQRTRYPVFALDVALDGASGVPVGQRAWVRLGLPAEPVAVQVGRRVRQLLLRQFDMSSCQRRRLLNYLQNTDIERYRSLIERLGLRR